jgi:hypothetical protein
VYVFFIARLLLFVRPRAPKVVKIQPMRNLVFAAGNMKSAIRGTADWLAEWSRVEFAGVGTSTVFPTA